MAGSATGALLLPTGRWHRDNHHLTCDTAVMVRRRLLIAVIGAFSLLVSAPASGATVNFDTPGSYDWVVPTGVTSATFSVAGARGGASTSSDGGNGGLVTATLTLTPGETLKITVGGAGADAPATVGGFNGGGLAGSQTCVVPPSTLYCNGGGGGGASDVRRGGTGVGDRVLVGGGGGGAGGRSADGCVGEGCVPATARSGGDGGDSGTNASNGSSSPGTTDGGCGGGGASGVAPGSAGGPFPGICFGPTGNTSAGGGYIGGRGGDAAGSGSGGGGGGGYFGGGGGSGGGGVGPRSGGGGGGGGSNFATPSATGVTILAGVGTGNGSVSITYGGTPTPPEISLSGSKSQKLGGKVVVDAKAISEETDFEATGSVKLPGPDQALRSAQETAATGAKVTLELKVPKQARRKIKKALKQGKEPVAELEVTGSDGDGDESTLTRSVRIRR